MMTGAYPAETGIIGNEWLDRATRQKGHKCSDDTVKLLGDNPNAIRLESTTPDGLDCWRRTATRDQ